MKILKIKSLNAEGNTSLVKDMETEQLYVEKIVPIRQQKVYEKLKVLELDNIPHIYGIEAFENGYIKIYEEYIEGENLQQLLDNGMIFSEQQTKTILINLCNILEKVHENKIVHRDIKPSNIIINKNLECFLIDFGIARTPDFDKSTDTRLLGTRGFAAPEQFGFGQSDERTDIYAMGVTANYILSGETDINKLYKGKITPIISKCIELKPASRYKSVAELKRALLKNNKWKYCVAILAGITAIVFSTVLIINHQRLNKKNNQETTELVNLAENTTSTDATTLNETTTELITIETTETTEISVTEATTAELITTEPITSMMIETTAEPIIETTEDITTETPCQHLHKIVHTTEWKETDGKHVRTKNYRCDDCYKKLETVEEAHTPEIKYNWDSMMSDIREYGFMNCRDKYPEVHYIRSCKDPVVLSCICKYCKLQIEIKPQAGKTSHDFGESTPNPFSSVYAYYALPTLTEDGYLSYVCESLCGEVIKDVILERGYHILMPNSNTCPECGVELTVDNKDKFKEYDLDTINEILELKKKYNNEQQICVN